MIEVIIIFTATTIASFIGSLQPGPVNLAVVHASLRENFSKSVMVATGGVLPELIYSALAFWFSIYLTRMEWLDEVFRYIAIMFFTVAGIYLLAKRAEIRNPNGEFHITRHFLFGFLSGFFNPLLFIFWLMVIGFYRYTSLPDVDNVIRGVAFVAGSVCGAFILLLATAKFVHIKKQKINTLLPKGIHRLSGIIFLILALWETIKIVL